MTVACEADVIIARQCGRALAEGLGFSRVDVVLITTAISELARNIVLYAGQGNVVLRSAHQDNREGIHIEARDEGPGVPDVELAMQPGYSTSGNLGLGLAGVRRLMDEMTLETKLGMGTSVVVKKWKR